MLPFGSFAANTECIPPSMPRRRVAVGVPRDTSSATSTSSLRCFSRTASAISSYFVDRARAGRVECQRPRRGRIGRLLRAEHIALLADIDFRFEVRDLNSSLPSLIIFQNGMCGLLRWRAKVLFAVMRNG